MLVKMRELTKQRDGLVELLEFTKLDGMVMIEVGSFAGESAEVFASSGKVRQLWCIDPWKSGYDENDIASRSNFCEVEREFDSVVERHPTVIHKYKGTLQDFVKEHPQVRPDIIYIDSCHTYDGCKKDLTTALELKPRFMSGHDYCENGWAGVKKAVNELVGVPDKVFQDESWIRKNDAT